MSFTKIRVLQVLGGLYSGGTESFVMNMYRSIDKEKFHFDFLIHEKSKAHYDDEVLSLGGSIYRIPDRTEVGTLKYILNLFKVLLKIKPDVIHAHAMYNSGVIMLVSFLVGIKKRIVHSHNTEDQFGNSNVRRLFRLMMRFFILVFSTNFLACSKGAAKYLYGKKILKKKNARVISNAINLNSFHYDEKVRNVMRGKLDVRDKVVLGHIGRFNNQKNHDFLIDIFKAFNDRNPNSILILIGDGELRSQIEMKIKRLGLSEKVKFLGIRDNVHEIMQAMDLFLLPSLYEGLPFVLIEAQSAGLNCIISDTITKDVDLTGQMKFLSLNDSPSVWASEISKSSYKHEDNSKIIRQKGYDANTNAKILGEIYAN